MPYLLDTNAWIDHLKHQAGPVSIRLQAQKPHDIVLCSIVKAELIHGAQRYANRARRLQILNRLFGSYVSLPFDDAAAEIYGL